MADSEKRDYYEVLGIKKDASDQDIKHAYILLAKKWHPDVNKSPEAPDKFKEITEAYEVLSDKQKRSMYDQFGFAGVNGPSGQPSAGYAGAAYQQGGGFDGFDVNDIFSQFFGGGRRQQSGRRNTGPVKGNDQVAKVRISFMDSIKGTDIEVPISYDDVCPDCDGTGAKGGAENYEDCPYCHGSGYVRTQTRTIFGVVEQQSVCSHCNGTGKIIKNKCPKCGGQGYVHVSSKLNIHIPSGIADQQQIRVQGKGTHGYNGGPSGDLYIVVSVASDNLFKRDGNDIHITVPVSAIDLILGTTLTVPTVYDDCDVEIRPGTPTDAVLRIKGHGVKSERGYEIPGDEYVHLNVNVPNNLTDEQKALLMKFQELELVKPSHDSFFEKFKKKFTGK